MTNLNTANAPRSIALTAALRMKALIARTDGDPFVQQAMRSANLVLEQSGLLTSCFAAQTRPQIFADTQNPTLTVH